MPAGKFDLTVLYREIFSSDHYNRANKNMFKTSGKKLEQWVKFLQIPKANRIAKDWA